MRHGEPGVRLAGHGRQPLPVGTPVGLPAWLNWAHFFNMLLMVLIIKTGLSVRNERKPAAYWAPKNNPRAKISLTLWLHLTLDIAWVALGAVFYVLLFATGQWARIVPTSWDTFPNAVSAGLQYLTLNWPEDKELAFTADELADRIEEYGAWGNDGVLLWGDLRNKYVWVVLVVMVGFGAIGWWDDWIKIVKRDPNGMRSRTKYALQSLLGDFQDAVTSRDRIQRLAEEARGRGEDTFAYGMLYQRELARGEEALEGYEAAIREVKKAFSKIKV